MSPADISEVERVYQDCVSQVERVLIGQRDALDGALVSLFSDGHALIEGVPGVAKTLLVRALSAALDGRFARVQFTADLMPADITGAMVLREGELQFRQGPIFTDLLLGDEINRAPAKTQSALLEAMQERAVTTDGERFELGSNFVVFATQNPIEQEGTYPLPEAELDRFMMMIRMEYPDEAGERAVLAAHHAAPASSPVSTIEPVADMAALGRIKARVREVMVSDAVLDYVTALVRSSRHHLSVAVGASPRAGLNLVRAAKAGACIKGRGFVTPDDVKRWAPAVLRHRIVLSPGAEIGGTTPDDVVAGLLESVDVPT